MAGLSWAKAKSRVKAELTESAAILQSSQDSPRFSSSKAHPKPTWQKLNQTFQHNGMKPQQQQPLSSGWNMFYMWASKGGASGKESTCQCRGHKRRGFNPWVWKISWSRKWQLTLVFLPGKFHGQRSLAVYSP